MNNPEKSRELELLHLLGGRPVLDLANTVDSRPSLDEPYDYLPDYEALARWAVHASVISKSHSDDLLARAAASPGGAKAVWRRAIALREAMSRISRALIAGETPAPKDLAVIDAERRRADGDTALVASGRGVGQSVPAVEIVPVESAELEAVLGPLVRSAVEVLTELDPTRLRVCPVEEGGCGWIVLDETRNRSRRWCDMRVCGNRAKAARLTARRRQARIRKSPVRSRSAGSR